MILAYHKTVIYTTIVHSAAVFEQTVHSTLHCCSYRDWKSQTRLHQGAEGFLQLFPHRHSLQCWRGLQRMLLSASTHTHTRILTMVLKAWCSCCRCRSKPQATHSPWQSLRPGVERHASSTTRHHRGIFITPGEAGANRSPAGRRVYNKGQQLEDLDEASDVGPAWRERTETEWQESCIDSSL